MAQLRAAIGNVLSRSGQAVGDYVNKLRGTPRGVSPVPASSLRTNAPLYGMSTNQGSVYFPQPRQITPSIQSRVGEVIKNTAKGFVGLQQQNLTGFTKPGFRPEAGPIFSALSPLETLTAASIRNAPGQTFRQKLASEVKVGGDIPGALESRGVPRLAAIPLGLGLAVALPGAGELASIKSLEKLAAVPLPQLTKNIAGVSKFDREIMGRFVEAVEKGVDKKELGSIGKYAQSIAEGIGLSPTLSNKRLAQAFNQVIEFADKRGFKPTQDLTAVTKPQTLKVSQDIIQGRKVQGQINKQVLAAQAGESAIGPPQLKVQGSEGLNRAFQHLAQSNPKDPLVSGGDNRLFENIADAIKTRRINVEDVPWFKENGFTNDQYLEVADAFKTAASFSGKTLNRLSETAKLISAKLPDVAKKADPSLYRQATSLLDKIVNMQGAALVSNIYTAARNALVASAKLPIQAIDDAIAGIVESATGKATTKEAFAPLANDFISVFRTFTKKEGDEFSQLFEKFPLLKTKLEGTPVAEVTLGSRVANALTTFNRFQDNVFTKIRFDALVRGQMERYGVQRMADLPAGVLNKSLSDALRFTFRGGPESGLMKDFIKATDNPVAKLGLFRFPRFMALSMEHLFNYSPAGFARLFDKGFRAKLLSKEPREAIQALSQATTGTMLFGLGAAIRNSESAGDKWYEVKVGDKVLDARGYQPLAAYLFLGDVMTGSRGIHNAQDALEGALGINRVAGTGLVLLDVVRSKTPDDTLKKIAENFAGQFIGGFTVPFRQTKLLAQKLGSQPEGIIRSTRENPLLDPAISNVPFLSRQLSPLPSLTRPGPVTVESPGFRLGGISLNTKNQIEQELGGVGIGSKDIAPRTGETEIDNRIGQIVGPALQSAGRLMQRNPQYANLSNEDKKVVLKKLITEVKSEAKQKVLAQYRKEIAINFNQQLSKLSKDEQKKLLSKWKHKGLLTEDVAAEMLLQRKGNNASQ